MPTSCTNPKKQVFFICIYPFHNVSIMLFYVFRYAKLSLDDLMLLFSVDTCVYIFTVCFLLFYILRVYRFVMTAVYILPFCFDSSLPFVQFTFCSINCFVRKSWIQKSSMLDLNVRKVVLHL